MWWWGGGGNAAPAKPAAATVTPASISLAFDFNDSVPVSISVTPTTPLVDGSFIFALTEKGPLDTLQLGGLLERQPDGSYRLDLSVPHPDTLDTLDTTARRGKLQFHACTGQIFPCATEPPGWPVEIPYEAVIKPMRNQKPLAPIPGLSDWAAVQGNAAHNGYVPATFDPTAFSRRWNQPLGGLSQLSTSIGLVFGIAHGKVQALRESDGTLAWEVSIDPYGAISAPAVSDGFAYVMVAKRGAGTDPAPTRQLWILDAGTGAIRSKVDVPAATVTPPSAARASTGSARTLASCISSDSPTNFDEPGPASAPYFATPVIGGESGYMEIADGGMLAFTVSDGTTRWLTPQGNVGHDYSFSDTDHDPKLVATDDRYVYSYIVESLQRSGLYALNRADGSLAFRIDGGAQNASVLDNHGPILGSKGFALVANRGYGLLGFDLVSKRLQYSIPILVSTSPSLANGVVYVGNDATLEARRESDGSLLWSWTADEPLIANVIATDNLVFISTTKRTYAIDLRTHQSVWQFDRHGALMLSAQGVLYIKHDLGTFDCFSHPFLLVAVNLL